MPKAFKNTGSEYVYFYHRQRNVSFALLPGDTKTFSDDLVRLFAADIAKTPALKELNSMNDTPEEAPKVDPDSSQKPKGKRKDADNKDDSPAPVTPDADPEATSFSDQESPH